MKKYKLSLKHLALMCCGCVIFICALAASFCSIMGDDIQKQEGTSALRLTAAEGAVITPVNGSSDAKITYGIPTTGDEVVYENYIYRYNQRYTKEGKWVSDDDLNGWGVRVADPSQANYTDMLSEIFGTKVVCADYAYYGCKNMFRSPMLSCHLTTMSSAFMACELLLEAPVIPNKVVSMEKAFSGCCSMVKATSIPSSVKNIDYTFENCKALIAAPYIMARTKSMDHTFLGCSAMIIASDIPAGVENLNSTFKGCTALLEAPEIPAGVVDMELTFAECSSMTKGPSEIPSSVASMIRTFRNCELMEGEMTVNANLDPEGYKECFYGTMREIHLDGKCKNLFDLKYATRNANIFIPEDGREYGKPVFGDEP